MSELAQVVGNALAFEYREKAGNLHKWVDQLNDEQFWRNPYTYGNSVGHLVLHLTGNLSYYIGARIAQSGYVRHRDLEFTEARKPAKGDVMRGFDEAIDMVVQTIEQQKASDWLLPYSGEREPEAKDRFTAVFRCATHFYHHVGQINYLCRELLKDSSKAVSH
jgi:uncharacterized damage-inducible protein DinB